MTTREGQGSAPGSGPASSQAGSSFDAAQDLLKAALDEVRGTPGPAPSPAPSPTPAPAPTKAKPKAKPKAPRTAAPAPAPATAPAVAAGPERTPHASDEDLWAPREPDRQPSRATARRRAAAAATAGAATAEVAADPAGTPRPTRRTRRNITLSSPDEFDGLTDELFQSPEAAPRRRRRTPGEDAAAVALGAELATRDALPPMPRVDQPDFSFASLDETATTPAPATEVTGLPPAPAAQAWLDDDPVVPAPTVNPYAEPPRRRRTGWIVVAVAAAIAVLIAFAVVVLPGGGGDDEQTALRTTPAARYTFDTVTTPEGTEVTRVWELRGRNGDRFVGRLDFVNPTSTALPTSFTEVIPKAIAPSADRIRFQPQPVIVQADPVVRYNVTIPAGGSFSARYEADVAPQGSKRSRLEAWAEDLPTDTTVTTTTTTTTAPAPSATTTTTTAPGRRPNTTQPGPSPTNPPTNPTNPPEFPTPQPTPPPPPTTDPPEPPTTQPPPPASTGIIVMRVVSKGGTGSFFMSGPGMSGVVETTGSPNGFGQIGYTVDVGSYAWTLEPADGWAFVGAGCEDRNGPSDTVVSGNTVIFNVQAGETVVCTFTVLKA